MTALSAADLEFMRSSCEATLPDTCSILSVTRSPDGSGGVTETWGTAAGGTAVPCRVDPIKSQSGGREAVAGGQLMAFTGYMLTLPHDTAITADNRVQYGGGTYNVISVDSGKSWNAEVRAQIQKV